MEILNQNSLYQTLDNLNQVLLEGKNLSFSERKKAAEWIADRQGLKGSYGNMFAPTEKDYRGIKLFTGDKLTSKASIGHILGEESLRALYLLGIKNEKINKSIDEARKEIGFVVQRSCELGHDVDGTYCCGKCTIAYWRNISAEGTDKNKNILNAGIKYLKSQRDGKGKWRKFPFFYTLLALADIDLPSAKEEMKYAWEVCERYLNRKGKKNIYGKRKTEISRRVLELS